MDIEFWSRRFAEHLQVSGRRPRTVISYVTEAKLFLRYLAERRVQVPEQIRREDVEGYQVHLYHSRKGNGEPLKLNTQRAKMNFVQAFLTYLYRQQVVLVNPGRHLVLPRSPRRLLPKLPSVDEVGRLLEAPDTNNSLGLRDRAILEVLYSSALRNAELRALRLDDVDTGRLQIRVVHGGKGGRSRVVPLGEPAAAWVDEYLAKARGFFVQDRICEFVFVTHHGRQLSNDTLNGLVKRQAKAAGLKTRLTPHTLRHCCATHMVAKEAKLRHIQELLGHVSSEATKIYTQVEFSDLREAHRRYHPRESL